MPLVAWSGLVMLRSFHFSKDNFEDDLNNIYVYFMSLIPQLSSPILLEYLVSCLSKFVSLSILFYLIIASIYPVTLFQS
jgi:hypothetical protein